MTIDWLALRTQHREQLAAEMERAAQYFKAQGAKLIVAFGSAVSGNVRTTSDLDLLVVLESPLPFLKRLHLHRQQLDLKVPADILIYTPEEFGSMQRRSFIRNALQTGKVIYGA